MKNKDFSGFEKPETRLQAKRDPNANFNTIRRKVIDQLSQSFQGFERNRLASSNFSSKSSPLGAVEPRKLAKRSLSPAVGFATLDAFFIGTDNGLIVGQYHLVEQLIDLLLELVLLSLELTALLPHLRPAL